MEFIQPKGEEVFGTRDRLLEVLIPRIEAANMPKHLMKMLYLEGPQSERVPTDIKNIVRDFCNGSMGCKEAKEKLEIIKNS